MRQLTLSCMLLFVSIYGATAQLKTPELNIGDPVSTLAMKEWLKGTPINEFEKGQVYVMEFWATWFTPCKAAMPELSELAGKYADKLKIVGVDIHEQSDDELARVRKFVEEMGPKMNYAVAVGDSMKIRTAFLEPIAEDRSGIPRTFVIDQQGRLAWIGHPSELAPVLAKLFANDWDLQTALQARNQQRKLDYLEWELSFEILRYAGGSNPAFPRKHDSLLLMIREQVELAPELKYTFVVAGHLFRTLIETDQDSAYRYGRELLSMSSKQEGAYETIFNVVETIGDTLHISPAIYELAIAARQRMIDDIIYPALVNTATLYHKMAMLQWRLCRNQDAIRSVEKAIAAARNSKFTKPGIAALKQQLKSYQNNRQ